MPLYKTFTPNSQTTVKIWKITESFDDLMDGLVLKQESSNRVLSMKSEWHQRGFLCARHLLMYLGYTDLDLYYDNNGKPHLADGKCISITHSFSFVGVILLNYFLLTTRTVPTFNFEPFILFQLLILSTDTPGNFWAILQRESPPLTFYVFAFEMSISSSFVVL